MKNSFLLFAFAIFLASCSSNKQTTAYVEDDIYWTASDDLGNTDYSSFTEVEEEAEYYNEGEAKSLEEGTVVNNYYGDTYYDNPYNNRRFRSFHPVYGYTYYNPNSYWNYSPYNYNPWRPSGFYLSIGYNPWAWGGYSYNPYGWNSGYGNPYYNGFGWGNYYYGGNGYYNGCPGYGGGYYSTGNDNGSGNYGYFGGRSSISTVSNGTVSNGSSEANGSTSNITNNTNERPNVSNTKAEKIVGSTKPNTRVERPLISNTRPLSLPIQNRIDRPTNTSVDQHRVERTRATLPMRTQENKRPETKDLILKTNKENKASKTSSKSSLNKGSRNSNRGTLNRSKSRSNNVQRSKSSLGSSRSVGTSRAKSSSNSGTRSSGSSRGRRK